MFGAVLALTADVHCLELVLREEGPATRRRWGPTTQGPPSPLPAPPPELQVCEAYRNFDYRAYVDGMGSPGSKSPIGCWMELPGMPGNRIRIIPNLKTMVRDDNPSNVIPQVPYRGEPVLYPSLVSRGLTVDFFSSQFEALIVMQFVDSLGFCPADHVWVNCLACDKFHFPWYGSNCHRCSTKHRKHLEWAENQSLSSVMAYHSQLKSSVRQRFM